MGVRERLKAIGPGAMVAAAFVGPGTVTTVSVTGAQFGYALLWTILFAIVTTVVLQEMSARLGLISREGLGEALRTQFDNPVAKTASVLLVVSAIGVGAAAFETGNILGGAAGLAVMTGISEQVWGPVIGLCAGIVLWIGRYDLIERLLVGLVAAMAVAFVLAAVLVRPDPTAVAAGFVPSIPEGSAFLITGMIGTTVVGYNLFLHASSVQERWSGASDLAECRTDTIASIVTGGVVTVAILVTAAAAFPTGTEIGDVATIATQLEPVAGTNAQIVFSVGLFAAGFTSATTAPLAGAYATAGALGWERDLTSTRFRAVWLAILGTGTFFSAIGSSPVEAIVFAQVANGILLPILAVFLIYVMNDQSILGEYTNTARQNVPGVLVTVVVIGLGLLTLAEVMGLV